MTTDPWSDPRVRKWKHHIEREVVPMIENCDTVISIAPPDGKVDVKFAVELGMAIMLGKPIIVVQRPGILVPPKLAKIADRVVNADLTTAEGAKAIGDLMDELHGDDHDL